MTNLTYKDAGVDTNEGERAVELMKAQVCKTFTKNVLTGLGGFGGLFRLPIDGMKEPVLVSGTDGVGTKLKVAFMMNKHDTVGIDCVAMCVNDILCQGAKPLFFLDYIATGKVVAERMAEIVSGIAQGCIQGESALVGGETAEMPGFYQDGEYDIAGFSVGIVDRDKIITGENIKAGDVILGIPSSGIHSNGYSLVRKVFFEKQGYAPKDYIEGLGETLGEALLRPTKIYTKVCSTLIDNFNIKGIVHVTGGGFFENVPRALPTGLGAEFQMGSWQTLPIFQEIQKCGSIATREMFSTFNMGIGMMMFLNKEDAAKAIHALRNIGEEGYQIGRVIETAEERVVLNGHL